MWLRGGKTRCGVAAPGCLMVLVVVVCVKGAFGVRFADLAGSTLDTHHHDQGRTQLCRSCSPEWSQFGGIRGVGAGSGVGVVQRRGLEHPVGTWDSWSDVPAPDRVYEVPGSALFARHMTGFVRMLVDAGQFRWAGTPSGGLGQEIACLRPPFPVPASPTPTPDSGMRTKPATSRAITGSSALWEGFHCWSGKTLNGSNETRPSAIQGLLPCPHRGLWPFG